MIKIKNYDDDENLLSKFGSAFSSGASKIGTSIVDRAKQFGRDLTQPKETLENSFPNASKKPQKMNLVSPLPADQTMGTPEHIEKRYNDFWNQADYKEALESEIKYKPTEINNEDVRGWIPIRDSEVIKIPVGNTRPGTIEPANGEVKGVSTSFKPREAFLRAEDVKDRVNAIVGSIESPQMKKKAAESFPVIATGFIEMGVNDRDVIDYALSTIMQEAGAGLSTVETLAQPGINARNDAVYKAQQGISGGPTYRGRGPIQLTHDYNYKKYGDMLGIDLVNNPDLAADPQISPKIMALFFMEPRSINGEKTSIVNEIKKGNYDRARVLIQGTGALSAPFYGDTQKISNRAMGFSSL